MGGIWQRNRKHGEKMPIIIVQTSVCFIKPLTLKLNFFGINPPMTLPAIAAGTITTPVVIQT